MFLQTFNYHTHTYRCGHADAEYCDEGYVIDLIRAGFTHMAFTDHIPRLNDRDRGEDTRMACSDIDGYLRSVADLKAKYAGIIEVESGYEAEYVSGEGAFLLERKNESGKFILGQHFVYDAAGEMRFLGRCAPLTDDDIERYAACVEEAVALGLPDIIAHPDLYAGLRESFTEADEEAARRICGAAAKAKIPLEINLHQVFSHTLRYKRLSNNESVEVQRVRMRESRYPVRRFWEIAAEYPVRVLYGVDAHYMGEIYAWEKAKVLADEIIGEETLKKLDFIERPF